jgi:hypothetical protein
VSYLEIMLTSPSVRGFVGDDALNRCLMEGHPSQKRGCLPDLARRNLVRLGGGHRYSAES